VQEAISSVSPPRTKQSSVKLNMGGAINKNSSGTVDLGSMTISTSTSAMGGASFEGSLWTLSRTFSTRRKPVVRSSFVFSGSCCDWLPGFRSSIRKKVSPGLGRFGVSVVNDTS